MSLRNRGSLKESEKPISPEKFQANTRKAHQLIPLGERGFRCSCAKVYSDTKNRSEAQVRHEMHLAAVLEALEDQRKGISYYDE